MNVQDLKMQGFVCRRERITGRGWLFGDGRMAFVVRNRAGIVVDPIGTANSARRAWCDAIRILAYREAKGAPPA